MINDCYAFHFRFVNYLFEPICFKYQILIISLFLNKTTKNMVTIKIYNNSNLIVYSQISL